MKLNTVSRRKTFHFETGVWGVLSACGQVNLRLFCWPRSGRWVQRTERVHPSLRSGFIILAGHVTSLITLAPCCSAVLAAGRLACRWTILLKKSASGPSEVGAQGGGGRGVLPELLCTLPLTDLPFVLSIVHFLSTCLLALRKWALISSVTISCQLSLANRRHAVRASAVSQTTFHFTQRRDDKSTTQAATNRKTKKL